MKAEHKPGEAMCHLLDTYRITRGFLLRTLKDSLNRRLRWGLMEVVYEWANGTVRLHPPLLSSTSPIDYLFK